MKYIIIIISFVASLGTLHAQDLTADSIIGSLLNKNDMLSLSKKYPILKNELHPFLQSMAASFLANSLNKPHTACLEFENLVNKYQNLMDFPTLITVLYMWANNMQYLGMYKESVNLLNSFLQSMPENSKRNVQIFFSTLLQIGNALKDCQQSQIHYCTKENSILPMKLIPVSTYGTLISIPVVISGMKEDFIFDTGAEGNAVSEEFAKKHQIKIIADSIETLGVTKLYSKLGLIDSIQIGNITYKNIPVNILPPSPDDRFFKINGILGLPFLKAVKEVKIYPSDKFLVIPYEQTLNIGIEPNIVFNNNQLCISTMIKDRNALLNFDTGSIFSYFNSKYSKEETDLIEKTGKKIKKIVGGFGKVDSVDVYHSFLQNIKIGNTTFKNLNWEVRMNNYLIDQRAETIGTLGTDVLLKCNEIIISTDKMVVYLSNENCKKNIYKISAYNKKYSLYPLFNNAMTDNVIPPSSSLSSKQPILFYRLSKKWGNIQKVDYTFDLNTMKWQPYNNNTLIRINK